MTLLPGNHVCCVVDSADERAAQAVSWAQEGLMASERVVYVESAQHSGTLLRSLERRGVDWHTPLREGQLVVADPQDTYLSDEAVDLEHRMSDYADFVADSLRQGYSGVRLSDDAAAALRVIPDVGRLRNYEERLEDLCRNQLLSGMCFYDRNVFGANVTKWASIHAGIAETHVHAVAQPGRVVISGEVDFTNVQLVAATLRKATPQAGELVIDLTELSFIDVGGTHELVRLARRIGPADRVKVIDPPLLLRSILTVTAWDGELEIVGGA